MTIRSLLPKKIVGLLTAPANVAIHGSPGSGKSWMCDQVVGQLEGCRLVRVDLSTESSGASLLLSVAREFQSQGSISAGEVDTRAAWRLAREAIGDQAEHVVLVLDQFDRVLQFPDAQEFLLLFRELVHRPETLRCTSLLVSRRSLQSIEAKIRGISTLASVCYIEYLGGVAVEDLAALGPGSAGLSAVETSECLSWSGGHASLAKYWLATRPDLHPDPAADHERARTVSRVLEHLAELGLLDAVAQLVLGPVIHDLLLERQELELLGIVPARSSDTGDSSRQTLANQAAFQDALRSLTRNMDPWGLLGQSEVRLRGVIDLMMHDVYGVHWPAIVGRKSPAVAKAHSEALIKMERDRRMFGREAPWLSYTYPGELWAIIQLEWANFDSVFSSRDKAYWRGVLTGLAEYRAPFAHGRPEVLGDAQRAQCCIYAEEVIRAIGQYERDSLGKVRISHDGST